MPHGSTGGGPLAKAFRAASRRHRLDVFATLILFVIAALAAGRVWRFPFDDEVITMVPQVPGAFRSSAWDLAGFYLEGGDIHPPLTFLFFSILYNFGIGEAAMRLCSLAMTATALALWQLLTLALLHHRSEAPITPTTRLIAVLLFGLSPLAIGQGDAIRWYPQFALFVALFVALYLAGNSRAVRLVSAIPLGLATSINLIAPLVIIPFAVYRYLLQRAWCRRFDVAYWAVFALFGAPGLYTAISVVRHQLAFLLRDQFGSNPVFAVAADTLGVLGGNAVGAGHAWAVIPVAVIASLALMTQTDRRQSKNPIHLFLLMLGMMAPIAMAGFVESRAFLYLAPVLAAILTSFLNQSVSTRANDRAILLTCCAVLPGIVAVGDLAAGTHPFKRNAAIPVGDVIDFISRNESGDTLVLSADQVTAWVLRQSDKASDRCVTYFFDNEKCFADTVPYQSVFVIDERSVRSRHERKLQLFAARIAEITRGRQMIAELHVGQDKDAALKTRLTGLPFDEFILTVDLFR